MTSRSALSQSQGGPRSYASANGTAGAPTAWNAPEFVCYGVNVTGPGIADTSFNPNPNPNLSALIAGTTACAYRGVVSNGFTFTAAQADISIDLQIPPGASRVIQLIGITNAAYCASNFLENGGSTNPGAYEIGRATADLFADTSVSIPITYSASESKRVDCGNGSSSTATLSPTVAIVSPAFGAFANQTNPNFTFTGTCSEEGQPVVLAVAGGSTSTSVCTTGIWSIFVPLSPVAEGAFTVTVTHVNTAGIAAIPSVRNYTKDTFAPVTANTLGWSNATPATTHALTAAWTPSTSADVSRQDVQFFGDGSCTSSLGAVLSVSPGISLLAFNAPVDGFYTYRVTTFDIAGNFSPSNCATALLTDTSPPAPATALGWTGTSPVASHSIIANWTPSTFGNLADESVQLYSDATCTTSVGALIDLGSATAHTYTFNTGVDGTYYFKVMSADAYVVSSNSICSPPMITDTTPPASANALAWAQAPLTNLATVNAVWTRSTSPDLAVQTVKFYSGAGCTTPVGTPVNLGPAAVTNPFTPTADGTYYYTITSLDGAGNSTLSACSAPITVDTTAPTLASASVVSGSPTFNHIFSLSYGTIGGPYTQYCIQENNNVQAGCVFTTGTLPPTYPVTMTSGPKVLSIWLKDAAGNVSIRVDTNAVTYDSSCDLLLATGNGMAPGSAYSISTVTQLASCMPTLDATGVYFFKLATSFPINSITTPLPHLQGTFDGNGQTLSGLSLTSATSNLGLFATVTNGTIENLTLSGVTINCSTGQSNCGALVGQALGGSAFINNHVIVSANITGYNNVGGLVGYADGTATFTSNSVDSLSLNILVGGSRAGGIVGAFTKEAPAGGTDFLMNRVSNSQANSCGNEMGGLAGEILVNTTSTSMSISQNAAKLSLNCASTPTISQLGGLIGTLSFGTSSLDSVVIKDSNIAGNFTPAAGTTMAAGIIGKVLGGVGSSNTLLVQGAIVRGSVSGSVSVGAILGGSDNISPGIAYTLSNVYWASQTYMTTPVLGNYYPAAPTATAAAGVALASMLTASNITGANFTNAAYWTLTNGLYPQLAFETSQL